MNWKYKGKEIKTIPEAYGFTYRIICTHKDYMGMYYLGKKALTHSKKKRITKKVIKETKTRKRVIREDVSSGWEKYYGSSKELNDIRKVIGDQYFTREILEFHKNKAWLSYAELKLIACSDALLDDMCFNKWASFRGYSINIKK